MRTPVGAVAAWAVGAALLVSSVAGCGNDGPGALHLAPPTPAGPAADGCAAVVAAAPHRVDGQARRDLSPPSRYAAAWGDPAIVLTCGGTAPAALTPTSSCFRVNGVDWLVTQHGKEVDQTGPVTGDLELTTVGRSVYVQVAVPGSYQPAADAVVDLSSAIKSTTTATRPCR